MNPVCIGIGWGRGDQQIFPSEPEAFYFTYDLKNEKCTLTIIVTVLVGRGLACWMLAFFTKCLIKYPLECSRPD
jgi:hypothetical protein